MTDWTGDPEELLTLDDAAKLIPGADAGTMRRLIRNGKLRAYRPGKKYLTTRADVRAAVIGCRVPSPAERERLKPTPAVPNSLGLTEMDLSRLALEKVLEESFTRHRERTCLERQQRKAARKPPRSPNDQLKQM